MQVEKRNARHFREEIHECPQNAGLFPDAELYEVLTGPSTLADKRAAKAELAVRLFLSRKRYSSKTQIGLSSVMSVLDSWVGAGILQRFFEMAETCGLCADNRQRIDRVFKVLDDSGSVLDDADRMALRRAFLPWLEADGVIPVFNDAGAYLLPFCFRGDDREAPIVQDASGNEVGEWTACLRCLQRDFGVAKNVQVAFHQNEFVCASGNSLMLPLVMAWYRKYVVRQEIRLPRYNPIRFLATGAIRGGRLQPVSVDEKLLKINNDVDDGFLVHPGNGKDEGSVCVDERIEDVLCRIRDFAELDYDTAPRNAYLRLRSLERAVRQCCPESWEEMNRRLDRLAQSIDEDQGEEYLNAVMLRSAARCHSGMTEEAKKLNECARKLAKAFPEYEGRLLRLQIEELVILQDEEDFRRIYSLAGSLGDRIEDYCAVHESERDLMHCLDLRMRYHGTMGQFEAYAFLSGMVGRSAEVSKKHFDMALGCAIKLSQKSLSEKAEDEYSVSVADCAQDANYLLLWAALFDEQNMGSVYARAQKYANKLRDFGCDSEAEKNDRFRRRFAALGMYRAVLKGAEIPDVEDDVDRAVTEGDPWIRATVGKYLGAVLAKKGFADTAKRLFEDASKTIGQRSGVLGKIHISVLAEAYRSMRVADSDYAEKMRVSALTELSNPNMVFPNHEEWRSWLESKGSDSEFPGLSFWY